MQKPEFHIIAVQNPKNDTITAWVREVPGLVTEGGSEEEIRDNLGIAFEDYIRMQREQLQKATYHFTDFKK